VEVNERYFIDDIKTRLRIKNIYCGCLWKRREREQRLYQYIGLLKFKNTGGKRDENEL
jgi:hypothetical protein